MAYNVIPTQVFLKDVKTLKKKYHNIVGDIDDLVGTLKQNPVVMGTSLGKNLYKIFAHNGLNGEAETFARERGILWSSRKEFDELLVHLGLRPLPDL